MFHETYERMTQFASSGPAFEEELKRARREFEVLTGELFETDLSFERRIGSFLEWYVLDRPLSFAPNKTPTLLYIESVAAGLTTPELNRLRGLTRTLLSLYEFKRAKGDHLLLVDLMDNTKLAVFERRKPVGLEPGDVFEARLFPYDDQVLMTESFTFHPREARKAIKRACKVYRKAVVPPPKVELVHRVAYLTNRSERYKHVDPAKIFAELDSYRADGGQRPPATNDSAAG
ncbi:MAG: hypothetical protein HY903_15465 [Deltaproteobacteria bacterium]|nr:hypothetical protein [Deltaproteobacteria bacterium]